MIATVGGFDVFVPMMYRSFGRPGVAETMNHDVKSLHLPMRSLLALVLLSITLSAYAQTADGPDTIIAQENAF